MIRRTAPISAVTALIVLGLLILNSGLFVKLAGVAYHILRGGSPDVEIFRRLGYNCLWYGALAVIVLLFFKSKDSFTRSDRSVDRLVLISTVFVVLAICAHGLICMKSAVIEGERYWWLVDDEMISMRYARNQTNGMGLVWNPGERVEGYSNFLWTMYMALIHLLPLPAAKTSLVVLITNVFIIIATIPVIAKVTRLLGGGTFETACVLVGFVLNLDVTTCTLDGFEAVPIMFLTIYTIYLIIKGMKDSRLRLSTFFLISLISLLRADGIVISLFLYGLALTLYNDRRKILIYSLISLVLPVLFLIFRLVYYGDILPNTAYLKVINWNGRLVAGLLFIKGIISHYLFLLVLVVLYTIKSRRAEVVYLTLTIFIYLGYIICVGGDNFYNNRFLLPFIPLLLIFGIRGVGTMKISSYWLPLLIALLFLTLPMQTAYTVSRPTKPEGVNIGNIEIGLIIKKNTPVDCTVADYWAGSVFYFSERRGVDLLGKVDPIISRMPPASDGRLPGHNKFDYDYSLTMKRPDLVVANFALPVDGEEMRACMDGDGAFTGRLYFHDQFQKQYLNNPVDIGTWRTIFIRADSPLASARDRWKGLEESR